MQPHAHTYSRSLSSLTGAQARLSPPHRLVLMLGTGRLKFRFCPFIFQSEQSLSVAISSAWQWLFVCVCVCVCVCDVFLSDKECFDCPYQSLDVSWKGNDEFLVSCYMISVLRDVCVCVFSLELIRMLCVRNAEWHESSLDGLAEPWSAQQQWRTLVFGSVAPLLWRSRTNLDRDWARYSYETLGGAWDLRHSPHIVDLDNSKRKHWTRLRTEGIMGK